MSHSLLADAQNSILAIVDIQERLASAMDPAARATMAKNAGILLQAAARLSIPVVATEQYPKGLGSTVAEIGVLLPPGSPRIEKLRFSCACEAPFLDALQRSGRSQVILAGMEAHVCVLQSALELHAAGRQVFVIADACFSRNPANHANAMHRLGAAGVIVGNTESLVFEWLRDAGHAQFKAISALLR
jgi:nicotinamidase-related amidase